MTLTYFKALSVLRNKQVMKNNHHISNHWHLRDIYIPVLYTHDLTESSWVLHDTDGGRIYFSGIWKISHREVTWVSAHHTVHGEVGTQPGLGCESWSLNQGRKNNQVSFVLLFLSSSKVFLEVPEKPEQPTLMAPNPYY